MRFRPFKPDTMTNTALEAARVERQNLEAVSVSRPVKSLFMLRSICAG